MSKHRILKQNIIGLSDKTSISQSMNEYMESSDHKMLVKS